MNFAAISIIGILIICSLAIAFLIDDNSNTKTIGIMISDKGDFSTHGSEMVMASQMAIYDFNQYLKNKNADWQLNTVSIDSGNPLHDIKKLKSQNIKLIVGAETSSKVSQIMDYANSNEMIVISPSSTAPSLAVADNIYRLVPDDTNQGKAIASLLEYQNIKSAILIVRNDTWGIDLSQTITNAYEKKGGEILSKVVYDPQNPDAVQTVLELDRVVEKHLYDQSQQHRPITTAVVLLSFGEGKDILFEASKYPVLDDIRWYGSDSNTNEEKILANEVTLDFIQRVSWKSVMFATEPNSIRDEIEVRMYEKLGYLPSTYAFSSYDAIWIAGLSMLEIDGDDTIKIKDVIFDVTKNYHGAIGNTELNENGDLVLANYDIWSVSYDQWFKIGNYDSVTDKITWTR